MEEMPKNGKFVTLGHDAGETQRSGKTVWVKARLARHARWPKKNGYFVLLALDVKTRQEKSCKTVLVAARSVGKFTTVLSSEIMWATSTYDRGYRRVTKNSKAGGVWAEPGKKNKPNTVEL